MPMGWFILPPWGQQKMDDGGFVCMVVSAPFAISPSWQARHCMDILSIEAPDPDLQERFFMCAASRVLCEKGSFLWHRTQKLPCPIFFLRKYVFRPEGS